MCQEDEFQKLLLQEFNRCLNIAKAVAKKYELNFLLSSHSYEGVEQQLIDAISKKMQVVKNNFIKNETIVKYTPKVIDGIDDFVKMKVDSPSLCCKQTSEQLKSHIKTFHYFEHMNQVRKFYEKIEDILKNLERIEGLYKNGWYYFNIQTTAPPDKLDYSGFHFTGIDVVSDPLIISLTSEVKDICFVNAAGISSYGEYRYEPKRSKNSHHVYKWVQSCSRLEELGFIIDDTCILKVKFDDQLESTY